MGESSLVELRTLLNPLDAGPIANTALVQAIESTLYEVWESFRGHDSHGMTSTKIMGRAESLEWKPPILRFVIERHGGTVLGSSRAEKQHWHINLDEMTAECASIGFRQLKPQRARLDVKPLAREIAELIVAGREDDRLKRDGGSVRILIGSIIPNDAAAQTVAGRHRRLRSCLAELLGPRGWVEQRPNTFVRAGDEATR